MILIIYILCKLHIMQLWFLVFKYSQVKEAHTDQDRITCEPVKLGEKTLQWLSMEQLIKCVWEHPRLRGQLA